jgi:ABC-type Na+ efflux pump permease subunit
MGKKIVISILAMLLVVSFISSGLCEEKKKAEKAKGMIILNQEKNYIKVLDEEYKTVTIYLDKKTKYEAVVKAKLKDFAQEKKESRLPKGTVTYKMKGGKPVATKVQYKGRQRSVKWAIKKKEKKK